MDDCQAPLPEQAKEGIRLFNAGKYFESHEELELAWRAEMRPIRDLYQGVLQAAVVYLHMKRSNYEGALRVYTRCMRILNRLPAQCCGVNIEALRTDLRRAVDAWRDLGAEHIDAMDWSLLKPVEWHE
jgi:predicted metal-dependent hydrolase